jgi:hypothetical protein
VCVTDEQNRKFQNFLRANEKFSEIYFSVTTIGGLIGCNIQNWTLPWVQMKKASVATKWLLSPLLLKSTQIAAFY